MAEFRHSGPRSIRIDWQFRACPDLIGKLPLSGMLIHLLFYNEKLEQ